MSMINSKTNVETIFKKYGMNRSSLLPCLEVMQEESRHITPEAVRYLREKLNIPTIEIYSIASLYGMFTIKKQGTYIVRLCNSLPCHINNSLEMLKIIEDVLGIKPGETTTDGKFTLEAVACLGLCDRAPAMMINEINYGNLTANYIKNILAGLPG